MRPFVGRSDLSFLASLLDSSRSSVELLAVLHSNLRARMPRRRQRLSNLEPSRMLVATRWSDHEKAVASCCCWPSTAGAVCGRAPQPKATAADPRAAIAKKFPGVKAEDIRPSPIKGLFEVRLGADIAYVSADGRYLISGDMFDIDSRTNLTEAAAPISAQASCSRSSMRKT